jgi:parvulin-like peptidyl-prolyl isomerase
VARSSKRILAIAALAAALEPCRLELAAHCPAFGLGASAWAQSNLIPPGLDPATGGGYAPGRGAPAAVMPNANNYGPMGPSAPVQNARPSSWPGGSQDPGRTAAPPVGAANPAQAQTPPPVAVPEHSLLEPPYDPAVILARVGSEVIQANEVLPSMHQMLTSWMEKQSKESVQFAQMSDAEKNELVLKFQPDVLKQALKDVITIKLLITEVKNKFPPDALKKNEEHMRKAFNDEYLKQLMATYKVESVSDLETKLREQGSSVEAQRHVFVDKNLALSWLKGQVKDEPEPTHEQMLTYYQEHAADWESPARAQWEQIAARFSQFNSKDDAWRAVAQWGNDVIVRGVPFHEVAKAHSQDISAEEGGRHDWTTKDSLRSEKLDHAIFSLPEGVLSRIIEDEEGLHIVRVIKREEFRRAPFNEVQPKIKERMTAGAQEKGMHRYLEQLREKTPVWNRLDDPTGSLAARPQPSAAR